LSAKKVGMMTTLAANGQARSRPKQTLEFDEHGALWLFVAADSAKIDEIKRTRQDELTDDQYAHMRKVVGNVHRHRFEAGGLALDLNDLGVVHRAHGPLHAAFFIPPCHHHRTRLEAVMGGEFQQRGMEADGIALPLEDDTFQVVVEHDPGQPTPGREGGLVATQEVGHARIEEEAQEDPTREAQGSISAGRCGRAALGRPA
jgi:hypothetical protein